MPGLPGRGMPPEESDPSKTSSSDCAHDSTSKAASLQSVKPAITVPRIILTEPSASGEDSSLVLRGIHDLDSEAGASAGVLHAS
ncbi:mCG129936 [Mus musculus]|nr:mCG129936 [Mus musculus]